MDRGAWGAAVHGVAESGTTEHAEEQDSTLAFGVMGPLRRCGQGLQRAVGCLGRRTKLYNRAEMVMVRPLYPVKKL